MSHPKPTILMILDGWGCREEAAHNATQLAETPNFDRIWANSPRAHLTTCGPDVGLPEGQMGNSEVGHLNIGAGRVVQQMLPRIDQAIACGAMERLLKESGFVDLLHQSRGTCHLIGLLSDGGVHSHLNHGLVLARVVAQAGIPVIVHVFTDGRDTAPGSAEAFVNEFEEAMPPNAVIGTLMGRYFAMDRDSRWGRVAEAYSAIAYAKGKASESALGAITQARQAGQTDEFISPTVIGNYQGMKNGDAFISYNFRTDRMRQIIAALTDPTFDEFPRLRIYFCAALSMVSYGAEFDSLVKPLFLQQNLDNGLSETISKAGLKQLHMAETEKYPHVTYFFNGGREEPFPGEERVLVPSPMVATYDQKPEMSAPELTDELVRAIRGAKYDLIVVNYANPDMVGHTGVLGAAIKAVEAVDVALGEVCTAVSEVGGVLLVIADHGNCEEMFDPATGQPHTAHTLNTVPIILEGDGRYHLRCGKLADVAPTILQLMKLRKPLAMSGNSLLSDRLSENS